MIKAQGKKNNRKLVVEYNNGAFLFNGKSDDGNMLELDVLLKTNLPIFGTYYSNDPKDDLNIIGKLGEYFFDNQVDVESDPEIVGEWEKGMVF